ncbi:flagellar biosynthesis protein FlgL [Erythrobacter sp. QSSC1-22B]|uniref:flagellin N-terminal helical domain-containing protein n=1 Tax=Erythrobacter sp. QSSC1-22B TaxID=1860125 RepID=UPI0008052B03|nr:flagellar biosynthesis protein FlgL [Erythrobacter sp. QSSC1-22B]OBX18865.1 flagellar biosynthesis protein FlgL [Erythrobacter sp. QSSC1-22B]
MINLSTGAFFERSTQQIGVLRSRAETLQQQIGTGNRIERSSDDPVAAARLRMLARSERMAAVDTRNSQLAEADLSLADQSLGSIADLVIRARELAVRGAAPTLSDDQRAAIGIEMKGLRDNLILLANSRNIAGHALLGGQATGAAYVDDGVTAQFVGTAAVDSLEIGEGQSVVPGLTGPEVFEFEAAGGPTDMFSVLGNLAAALTVGGGTATQASSDALASLDAGLAKITTAQTVVGARLNWVDLMTERRDNNAERLAGERADVGGADIAVTMSRLQETLTVLEATQSSFVRLANLSLFSMLR